MARIRDKVKQAIYRKTWYEKNKLRQRNNVSRNRERRREENRLFISEYLKLNPCIDCGFSDIRALDFDHVRGIKKDHVSVLAYRKICSIKILKEEIEKCEVRCSNCHRIITREREKNKLDR